MIFMMKFFSRNDNRRSAIVSAAALAFGVLIASGEGRTQSSATAPNNALQATCEDARA